MKKEVCIIILILAVQNATCQDVDGKDLLALRINRQISKDLNNQDTSFFLFSLSTGSRPLKEGRVVFVDSLKFSFVKGMHLRFYLVGSGENNMNAKLRLYRYMRDYKVPDILLKEIVLNPGNKEIQTFDYFLQKSEVFIIYLVQNPDSQGQVVTVATQFYPPGTRPSKR